MHQIGVHLLGTAPPMPPPPLVQSLPEPLRESHVYSFTFAKRPQLGTKPKSNINSLNPGGEKTTPLFSGCGLRAYVAGGEGLHAPLEQHGNVQPRQGGQLKSAQSSRHQQNAARQYAYMCAPCTHSNAFSKTTLRAGHALQSKQSRGHKPIYPC